MPHLELPITLSLEANSKMPTIRFSEAQRIPFYEGYLMGWLLCYAGSNPYPSYTPSGTAWHLGWTDGRGERYLPKITKAVLKAAL